MPFTRKTWVDRLVEFAGRRKLTDVTTQTVQTVDVARDEGNVSQEGTAFSAANMNDLEQRIADCVSAMETTFQNGVDTLYNKCVSRGATPSDKTPTAIAGAIDTIYSNRYSEGYTAGRSQGQQDVINNPAAYGIPLRSGYQKLVDFTQWPNEGRTITTTITDYSRYREISQSNIVVGIRVTYGHGSNGPEMTIQAYCSGYDANSGTVSIFISGDIQRGQIVLSVI